MFRLKIPINNTKIKAKTFYVSPETELIMQNGKEVVASPLEDLRLSTIAGYVFSQKLTIAGGIIWVKIWLTEVFGNKVEPYVLTYTIPLILEKLKINYQKFILEIKLLNMENKQKKYNSVLLFFGTVATIFAIYFGVKSNNLSNELSKTNLAILNNENSAKINSNSVSKIDELLFKGEYNDALKITTKLKEVNFKNDSMLLLRHHLVSEIITVKSLEKTTTKQFLPTTTSNKNTAFHDF